MEKMESKDDEVVIENQSVTDGPAVTPNKLTEIILHLEEIDTNIYRANYLWKTLTRGVYGGQIIGQALVAAGKTVAARLHVHSLHCYFLLKGDGTRPIIYQVDIVRDGRSFSTRRVNAKQNGEVIFTCMISYHIDEHAPTSYQYAMPRVPAPDTLPMYDDVFTERLRSGDLSDYQRVFMTVYLARQMTFFVKPVPTTGLITLDSLRKAKHPRLLVWIKVKDSMDAYDQSLHRCAVAYISDSFILHAYLMFANHDVQMPPAFIASLDHALWFHAPFRADHWMLYECESPRMVGNRALYHGRIWKEDGTLAVSVVQEFLVRPHSSL